MPAQRRFEFAVRRTFQTSAEKLFFYRAPRSANDYFDPAFTSMTLEDAAALHADLGAFLAKRAIGGST